MHTPNPSAHACTTPAKGTYRVLSVNDDRDFCECCGRQGLKRVVWIEDVEAGDIKHFGTTCATTPSKGFHLDKEVREAISRHDSYVKCLNQIAHVEYKKAGGTYQWVNSYTARPADMALYNTTRQAAAARGFNY